MNTAISVAALTNPLAKNTRILRKPKHTFSIRQKPFEITPILIAPVLPGETMTSALYQSRAVSDPIANPLIGWWLEYYFFYVKLRDLDARDTITEVMLDPAATMASLNVAADNPSTYAKTGNPDFVELCRRRVVAEYFRDEGEAWNVPAGMSGNIPLMKAVPKGANWMDSIMRDATVKTANDLQNPHDTVDLSQYQLAYDRMRTMRMIDMTFDEWLGTFGVSVRTDEQQHIPELLRYYRAWTYPANTVDPTTGVPSSACSWAVSDTLEKDRFFREPGFIVGYSVARPKLYLSGQTMAAANLLNTAEAWLPPMLRDQGWSSIVKVASNAGLLGGQGASPANDFWVDLRDLWLYGDQFTNHDISAAGNSSVPLPAANLQKEYVTTAMTTALFTTAAKNMVRQDGVIDFKIKGHPTTGTDLT